MQPEYMIPFAEPYIGIIKKKKKYELKKTSMKSQSSPPRKNQN